MTRSTAARAVEWGLASESVPSDELDGAAFALARRVALLPANQLHMMKVLVNQAFEQMGLHTTQLVGHAARRRARGTRPRARRSATAAKVDVRKAVRERDTQFGDYGEGPRTV